MKLVRCVPTIVAAYAAIPNAGQVSAVRGSGAEQLRFAHVCRGLRLACSSRVTGRPAISSAGATMISSRCWIMWSQNSTSS